MINKKLHTPEGVKDYLPDESFFKRSIEKNIEKIFESYGYFQVKSPMFEYIEVFEGKGGVEGKEMYKFLDRNGDLLALRSEMTPAIARIAATAYDSSEIPFRFYYIENSFRYNENYQGKLREFTQAGIELIGINSYDADAEVVSAAVNGLIAAGLEKFKINIGQVQFFKGVLEESCLDEKTCESIQNALIMKDYVEAESIVKESSAPENIKKLFSELPLLIGNKDVINNARNYVKNKRSIDSLNDLENIYNILNDDYSLSDYILFDLSLIGHFNYYTGIIFRGYTDGTGFSIVDGGRYDKLVNSYGADFPSIGFAIKINDLMSALENQNINFSLSSNSTLIAFSDKGRKRAFETALEMRKQGLKIECSLFKNDIDKIKKYAESKKIGGILYFIDDEMVRIINLEQNSEQNIKISDLLSKED